MIETTTSGPPVAHPDEATIRIFETAGHSTVAIAAGVLALIPALLLEGWLRYLAIGGIALVVAWFIDVFEFDVDLPRREVRIKTLWWGLFQRRSKTYSFSDVKSLHKVESIGASGTSGYRWEFVDGAIYELSAPLDPRLVETFSKDASDLQA